MEDWKSDRSFPVITVFEWDPFSSGGLEPGAQTKFEMDLGSLCFCVLFTIFLSMVIWVGKSCLWSLRGFVLVYIDALKLSTHLTFSTSAKLPWNVKFNDLQIIYCIIVTWVIWCTPARELLPFCLYWCETKQPTVWLLPFTSHKACSKEEKEDRFGTSLVGFFLSAVEKLHQKEIWT